MIRDSESSDTDKISYLKNLVRDFCEARDWDQFHSSKELAIGVATEAAELLAEFRFLDEAQMAALWRNPESRQKVEDEMADVLMFLLRMSQRFDVDLGGALVRKLEKTNRKYPIEKAKGRNDKYDKL